MKDGCTILGAEDHLENITVGEVEMDDKETFIVLYTDGLTDLRDGSGAYFDEDMISDFACSHRNDSATNFNKKLLEELEKFKGKQAYPDDIAVLTAKIKPSK